MADPGRATDLDQTLTGRSPRGHLAVRRTLRPTKRGENAAKDALPVFPARRQARSRTHLVPAPGAAART
jgi:hypothetical protein